MVDAPRLGFVGSKDFERTLLEQECMLKRILRFPFDGKESRRMYAEPRIHSLVNVRNAARSIPKLIVVLEVPPNGPN